MDQCDDAGRPGGGSRECCGRKVGGRWMESCCVAVAKECELDEEHFGKVRQGRAAGAEPVCMEFLREESLHDAVKAQTVCCI